MSKPDFDKEAENTKFDIKAEAQRQKMDAAPSQNPAHQPQPNVEPNAGGQNRNKGHRG